MKTKNHFAIYFPLILVKLPKLKLKLNKNLLLNLFFLGFLPAIFFYISQTTKLIYLNYNLSKLEQNMQKLTIENNSFEKSKLQNYSFKDIENKISNLGFKNSKEVKYLNISEKYLAQLKK
ncbi:MAG: hypothetical protein ACP5H7_00075 [Minisyncoccia bacterium]